MRVKCPACGEEFAVEESTRQRIVETIRNSEKELTYSELFDRVDIASKRTFNERLKDLEREGRIVREHKIPDEGRPKNVIVLR